MHAHWIDAGLQMQSNPYLAPWRCLKSHLECGPPQKFAHKGLYSPRVHWQREQDSHGDHGPIVMMNPPRLDAAPIHLQAVNFGGFSSTCPVAVEVAGDFMLRVPPAGCLLHRQATVLQT